MIEEELNQMSKNELIGIIKAQKFEIEQLENIRKEAINFVNKMWLAKLTPGTVSDTKFDLLNILNKGE